MKTTRLLLIYAAIFLLPFFSFSQIIENFTDGDFTNNPSWSGSLNSWTINNNLQLQSSNTTTNSTYYLSTASIFATTTQWEFNVDLNFNTSSANYADVFLTASASDLTNNNTTGYLVRIGNTDDEVSLYRKDAGGLVTKIIDGVNGITNSTSSHLKIKVIRDAGNQFTLYRDEGNTGIFTSEGSVTDATYLNSSFFGFLVKQSTSSFFQKHFFDGIIVKEYHPDITPPAIKSVTATSVRTIDVLFTEPVDAASAQMASNYLINNVERPVFVQTDALNPALVHLSFSNNFSTGVNTIIINGVKDVAGNAISNAGTMFSFFMPQRFDVVIDEIMADPSPQIGLPNTEYIELKNVSGRDINLQGWKLSTYSANSGSFPDFVLPADSFLIITSTTQAQNFTAYGRVAGVGSFPSIHNDSSTLVLTSKDNIIIHAVSYNIGWYGSATKKEGGWSLEMIDTHNPCSGQSNWKASVHDSGGTPGKRNSVDAVNKDETAPFLKNAYVADSATIILTFNEPVDSSSSANPAHYKMTPGIAVRAASALLPGFTQVQLQLSAPLLSSVIYALEPTGITDCAGNEISSHAIRIGLPESASGKDVVVNEILFNPKPNAPEYIELYNRSHKIIDASKLYIANRNSAGVISSLKKLSSQPLYIFPDSYLVVTEDASGLQKNYWVKNEDVVITLSLPSLPDDAGRVIVTDDQGKVLDEVHYSRDWHFNLIANDEGVALERIDPDGQSENKSNWHSAASTSGYGTPTYKNSQFKETAITGATLEITPKIFSPDNDGYDDIATIQYQVATGGYMANITIFDANGRFIRHLVKNDILGQKGTWHWDGLDEQGKNLSAGNYIIYTELFNLQGKKVRFKNTIVLARWW
jgi:hypothetical protein